MKRTVLRIRDDFNGNNCLVSEFVWKFSQTPLKISLLTLNQELSLINKGPLKISSNSIYSELYSQNSLFPFSFLHFFCYYLVPKSIGSRCRKISDRNEWKTHADIELNTKRHQHPNTTGQQPFRPPKNALKEVTVVFKLSTTRTMRLLKDQDENGFVISKFHPSNLIYKLIDSLINSLYVYSTMRRTVTEMKKRPMRMMIRISWTLATNRLID